MFKNFMIVILTGLLLTSLLLNYDQALINASIISHPAGK